MLNSLAHLVGSEHAFSAVCAELRRVARTSGMSAMGALHLTCSDESEFECTDAFRRDFAQETLPRLKYGSHVPFRIANPGARYEWGSTSIAEDHFCTAAARRGGLLMVAKINTHVAVTRSGSGGVAFGRMERYGDPSTYCGAVGAVLNGGDLPFIHALEDELRSDGLDRVAILRDAEGFDAKLAPLYGAVATARLHARRVVQDVQDAGHAVPCIYVVVHGVTLNRAGLDSELIGGVYVLDRSGAKPNDQYVGLGDDPRAYEFSSEGGNVSVSEPGMTKLRAARNHRELAAARLGAMRPDLGRPEIAAAVHEARRTSGAARTARAMLRPVLGALAGLSPVPAALWLFAEGLVGVHHAVRVQRAGSDAEREEAARDIVAAFEERLAGMPPAEAEALLARIGAAAADARA